MAERQGWRSIAASAFMLSQTTVSWSLLRVDSRAGPILPFPWKHIRVEHWVVAERRGPTARAICWVSAIFDAVPFFLEPAYDVPINSAGHAESGTDHWSNCKSPARMACCNTARAAAVLAVASDLSRSVEP